MPEEFPLEEVQGPIYAWRAYRIEQITADYQSSWVLTPLYYRGSYEGKPGYAVAGQPSSVFVDPLEWSVADRIPDIDQHDLAGGMPGFHCFHGYGQAVAYANSGLRGSPGIKDVVVALVELGGEVIEHEMGFRAEKTRIVELQHGNPDENVRNNLAAALGWPFDIKHCDLLDGAEAQRQFHKDINELAHELHIIGRTHGYDKKQLKVLLANLQAQLQQKALERAEQALEQIQSAPMQISISPETDAFRRKIKAEIMTQFALNDRASLQKIITLDP